MAEVIACGDFEAWFVTLSEDARVSVAIVIDLLEELGVALGAPHSSDVRGASFPLRELRPKRGKSPLRIFYAFDPKRRATLLTGGGKSGMSRRLFYSRMIDRSERHWEFHVTKCP